jgi:branched-chain amino acid transport system permease protein
MDGPSVRRLLRVLVAAVGAFVLSFPLVAVTASDAAGFGVRAAAPFVVAGIVLAVGVALTLLLALGDALGPWLGGRASSPGRTGVHRVRFVLAALFVALAALPLLGVPDKYRDMTLETLVYVTIAVGLNITIGMAGLLVLGHAAFWAVGAYAFTLTTVHWHWNFWIAFPAAGAAAAAAGFVIGLPALRLRGDYLAVVTLGFGEAVRQVLTNESKITGGDVGVPGAEVRGSLWEAQGALGEWLWQPGVGANGTRGVYWFALALAAACVVAVTLLARSRLGRALYALREDETAARCMGIDTVRVKLVAFMSSAFWAGLAGTATAVYRGSISPGLFNFDQSVLCVAMVVLGGLGSIPGAVLGAALLYALPLFLQDWVPDAQNYRLLVLGAVMVGMMVVRPTGLLGRSSGKAAS